MGTILRVNLSDRSFKTESINQELTRQFLGGRGLAGRLLLDEIKQGIDPLGEMNKIIFATGPLTGTPCPGADRYVLVTKSPQTGLFLDSYSGGHFGPELKFAGYDLLIIEGKSPIPIYLWIHDDIVEIKDAGHLWGMKTWESETSLKEEVGDINARVCLIGPAGERLSNLAVVQNDYFHQAGRGGIGTVFGSKNLKAVVVRGHKEIPVADPVGLLNHNLGPVEQKFSSADGRFGPVADRMKYGTPLTLNLTQMWGILPTRNFLSGQFKNSSAIDGYAIREKVVKADKACYSCNLACGKFSKVDDGPYKGTMVGGPEYETMALFGSNLGISSAEAIIKANEICDQLGLDTVGAGNVIGFAIECYERGIIDQRDTNGIELSFNNFEVVKQLLHDLAYRQGIGDLLSNGVRAAAKIFGKGSEEFAMHSKGLEFPGYRPGPCSPGFALAYAVAERGGCHRRAWPAAMEQNLEFCSSKGRAKVVKELYDSRIPWHCGLSCDIATQVPGLDYSDAAVMYQKVTGWDIDVAELESLGDRVATVLRLFNMREGALRSDDWVPKRTFAEDVDGPGKGYALTPDMLNEMLDEYYDLRGWDIDGIPKKDTLQRLGIGDLSFLIEGGV